MTYAAVVADRDHWKEQARQQMNSIELWTNEQASAGRKILDAEAMAEEWKDKADKATREAEQWKLEFQRLAEELCKMGNSTEEEATN